MTLRRSRSMNRWNPPPGRPSPRAGASRGAGRAASGACCSAVALGRLRPGTPAERSAPTSGLRSQHLVVSSVGGCGAVGPGHGHTADQRSRVRAPPFQPVPQPPVADARHRGCSARCARGAPRPAARPRRAPATPRTRRCSSRHRAGRSFRVKAVERLHLLDRVALDRGAKPLANGAVEVHEDPRREAGRPPPPRASRSGPSGA